MFLLLHWWNNIVICKKNLPIPCHPPYPLSPFIKILISIIEKKINENCVDFDFKMSAVLVIFSFFWTDNNLVYVPPPPEWYLPLSRHHNYAHTLAHISKITGKIFMKLWDIVPNNIRVINLHLTKNILCRRWV